MSEERGYSLDPDVFTLEGLDDRAKPCIATEGCTGKTLPTRNAKIGRCDTCEKEIAWEDYQEEEEK